MFLSSPQPLSWAMSRTAEIFVGHEAGGNLSTSLLVSPEEPLLGCVSVKQ